MTHKHRKGLFHESDGNGGFYITKEKLQSFYVIAGFLIIFASIISWAVAAQTGSASRDILLDQKIETNKEVTEQNIAYIRADVADVKADVKEIKAILMERE